MQWRLNMKSIFLSSQLFPPPCQLCSCTWQLNARESVSNAYCRCSSGTRVELVLKEDMFNDGTESTWLMALTIPVSLKSIGRPQSLTTFHRWGETINACSGNLSTSDSSKRNVSSSWHRHIPQRYVALYINVREFSSVIELILSWHSNCSNCSLLSGMLLPEANCSSLL